MEKFTFHSEGNAYFNGRDLVATRERDGRTIKVNDKDGYVAVNVKDRKHPYGFLSELPEGLAEKAADLNRANASQIEGHEWISEWTGLLYGRAQETFWSDAKFLAKEAGFKGVYGGGRSSGWCLIDGARSDDWRDTIMYPERLSDDPEDQEYHREEQARILNLLIDIEDLIEDCHGYWYEDIANEHAELERERERCFVRGTD